MSNLDQTLMQIIWGNEFVDAGFTSKPIILTRYAIKEKLVTLGEYFFIEVLCSFKHSSSDPFPKQDTIADMMGVSTRQVRKYITSLEEKGWLEVEYIYIDDKRASTAYNFQNLLNACLAFHREEQMKENIKKGVKKVKKVRAPKKDLVEQQVPDLVEHRVPVGTGLQVPQAEEHHVPLIIDKLINKSLINKLINQSIYNEQVAYMINKFFKNLTDRQIENIFVLYNDFKEELNIENNSVLFKGILIDVSENLHKMRDKRKFKSYLKTAIERRLSKQPQQETKEAQQESVNDFISIQAEKEKEAKEEVERAKNDPAIQAEIEAIRKSLLDTQREIKENAEKGVYNR
jgi:DNA-binding Lrp family transcriptional regulator